jgi:uncharacterized protein
VTERLTNDQCSLIVEALAEVEPAVIYLFGSYGGPAQHPESDIDIAFLAAEPPNAVRCFEIANRLADRLGRSVDLIDLKQASTVLAKEVLRTGTAIFIGDSRAHQEFEMLALSNYARLNEERQPILNLP